MGAGGGQGGQGAFWMEERQKDAGMISQWFIKM